VLFFWLACNGIYFFVVLMLPASNNPKVINDGSFTWLEYFTCFIAAIVVFRVTFATLYICKWRCRYCCNKKYQVSEYNMEREFQKIRKEARHGGMSTDDDRMLEQVRIVYKEKERKINKKKRLGPQATERQRLEATLDYIHDKQIKDKKAKRGGMTELAEAEKEEVEDKLVEERTMKRDGLTQNDVARISKNVAQDLDISVLSAVMKQDEFVSHYRERIESIRSKHMAKYQEEGTEITNGNSFISNGTGSKVNFAMPAANLAFRTEEAPVT